MENLEANDQAWSRNFQGVLTIFKRLADVLTSMALEIRHGSPRRRRPESQLRRCEKSSVSECESRFISLVGAGYAQP